MNLTPKPEQTPGSQERGAAFFYVNIIDSQRSIEILILIKKKHNSIDFISRPASCEQTNPYITTKVDEGFLNSAFIHGQTFNL